MKRVLNADRWVFPRELTDQDVARLSIGYAAPCPGCSCEHEEVWHLNPCSDPIALINNIVEALDAKVQ